MSQLQITVLLTYYSPAPQKWWQVFPLNPRGRRWGNGCQSDSLRWMTCHSTQYLKQTWNQKATYHNAIIIRKRVHAHALYFHGADTHLPRKQNNDGILAHAEIPEDVPVAILHFKFSPLFFLLAVKRKTSLLIYSFILPLDVFFWILEQLYTSLQLTWT